MGTDIDPAPPASAGNTICDPSVHAQCHQVSGTFSARTASATGKHATNPVHHFQWQSVASGGRETTDVSRDAGCHIARRGLPFLVRGNATV